MSQVCIHCGQPLTAEQVSHGVEYHRVCFGQFSKTKREKWAKTPWAKFLARKRAELGISQNDLARILGVSPARMTRQLQGARPSDDLVARVQALYPGEVPDDVETETARRRAWATAELEVLNAVPREKRIERAKKAGEESGKRNRRKPGHSKKMRAWHASPAGQEHHRRLVDMDGPRLTAEVKSVKGRIVLELTTYLRDHPELRAQADALDVLQARAQLVAERGDHGLPADAVWQIWKPYLRKKGYPVGAGRPANDWLAVDRRKRELEQAGQRRVWPVLGDEFGVAPESLARGYRRWRQEQHSA